MRRRILWAAGLGLLTGCQGPSAPLSLTGEGPSLTLERSGLESAVANARVIDWSSNTFNSEAILRAREARAGALAGYKLQYTSLGSPIWTRSHVGHQTSNAPAYAFADLNASGPGPNAGDKLLYMTNAPRGTAAFFVVDPQSGLPLNGGWDVLTTVGAPGGHRVDNSAITLSARATQAMFVTTAGFFGAVRTSNGTKLAGYSLGAGRQCLNTAPFIDNSKFPGNDTRMSVWLASTDNTGSAGQLHNMQYDASGAGWGAPSAITVSGPAADGTGGTLTAAGFKCSPVVYRGKVYIGDVAGRFWEYDISSNSARYWDLSPFSGLTSDQIIAPAAFDIGGNNVADRVFVACGTRVFWIDPASNMAVPSQNLVVDTATSTPGAKLQDALDSYSYTGSLVPDIYAAESISVGDRFDVGNPSINNYEITGSYGLDTPTDGRPVSGYVRFNVGNNAYGGRLPIAAQLTMTVDNYFIPNASDAGSIFRASNALKNTNGTDSTTIWTRNNLTWRNQPRLLVPNPFATRTGPAAQYAQVTWNVSGAVPRDGDNYTFVLRGNGKQYNGAAGAATTSPGYYGCTATTTRRPRLRVTCSPYSLTGAIKTQPILLALGANPRLYVANANALFELNYKNTGTFANAADTYFSLTASGRGGAGNTGVVVANKFVQNQVTTTLGMSAGQYHMYVCDHNGVGVPHLNKFTVPLNQATNADSLTKVFNMPAGVLRSTSYIIWDYFGGSLYFADQGPGTSTMYRLPQ